MSILSSNSTHSDDFAVVPFYYRLMVALLRPIYRLQVWHRSRKNKNYTDEVNQRFGQCYPDRPSVAEKGVIWCHAVSLGETNTIAPLLDILLQEGFGIWLTNTTQTGFNRVSERFANAIENGQLSHSYVPIDSDAVVVKFLNHVQPISALFVETELWANILSQLAQRKIPSILVNGRLSQKSFDGYEKVAKVSAGMMHNLTVIIAQDENSAKRFRQLGAKSSQIRVVGSLKWVVSDKQTEVNAQSDSQVESVVEVEQDSLVYSQQLGDLAIKLRQSARPIWVAGSTHLGEETAVLAVHQRLLQAGYQKALLILVPRHPERFDEVAKEVEKSGLKMARRSKNDEVTQDTQVYLADSMGELLAWYELAQVAFVGGSLVDVGGHNPIEALKVGTPVIMGQYTQSCQAIVDILVEKGALYQVSDETNYEAFFQRLSHWLANPEEAKKSALSGQALVDEQQVILIRQLDIIRQTIGQHLQDLQKT